MNAPAHGLEVRLGSAHTRKTLQAAGEPPRLRGDLGVWLVILLELMTFAVLFVAYAVVRSQNVALFNASQATLNLHSGALNTLWLITGSACVAAAVAAMRRGARTHCLRWLVGAMCCGAGFVLIKLWEYRRAVLAGTNFSDNTFYLFYLMLTGFHFLHVVLALGALAYLAWRVHRGAYCARDCDALETGAAFWHMVDLLWIVLFPLIYVMR